MKLTLEQAILQAQKQGDAADQMRLVYKYQGGYWIAATLPIHGIRVGNYYPASYTRPGYFPKEMQ